MCLEALGVVKVATAEQIRQLTCPGTKDAATIRGGLKDLEDEKLVISAGTATRLNKVGNRVTEKLWNLTPAGLEAAAVVLDRPAKEMGGTAKASAASGAKHARKVTDTLAAFLQTPPEATQPVTRTAIPAQQRTLRERPPGMGPLAAWTTEAVLPVAGTFTTPARGSLRADLVFATPGESVPLLFVEVDNGTEGPPILAEKVNRYARFFARKATGTDTRLWQTVWPHDPGSRACPPVALVFTKKVSPEAMQARMREVGQLARDHWQGTWHSGYDWPGEKPDGYRDYTGTVPLLATTLRLLAAKGPHGPVWWRYGHSTWQSLTDALDNPDDYRAYSIREDARRAVRQAEEQRREEELEEERRRREAGKWACPTCRMTVYPGQDRTRGDECQPCRNERQKREAEEEYARAVSEEAQAAKRGRFGLRRRP